MTQPDRALILGAGLAGGNVAATLRDEGFRGRVVLVGDEPTPPFGRPPLSKGYLRGEETLDGWMVRPPDWYAANGVEIVAGRALHVDVDAGAVRLLDGGVTLAYDLLAICTGGRPRRPAIPGADLEGVHALRTVADCEGIRRAALPGRRAVVLGMGFIGSEVAASLRDLGVEVTAVLTGDGPLQAVLGPEMAAVMGAIHRERGVELVTNDAITAFEGDGRVERAVTRGGSRIACDLAVVGAGIAPDVTALSGSRLPVGDGVLVDERCRAGAAGVYAAGDVAGHLHPLFGRLRVEHYNNAEKMGRAVARSMLGDPAPYADVHTFWSDQYEHTLEYVGHATAWDTFAVRGSLEERRLIGFYLRGGVMRAAVGLDRGGDPELEPQSDMAICRALVATAAEVSADDLCDERVELASLIPER
ncbi:MAG TPA: FAD-dependent oxidoreductase [Candidatus Dormibacteraeota bacterium]|nr:FAD-dependent oxidoreductase [Candidatus Dormibacteraeota bacterium]